ncbi:MAG TPA: response regulator transcription factor [Bryobacteraceae bacterium]|nr:response regulator transcription factor [Bryobacteraceae bacterium]
MGRIKTISKVIIADANVLFRRGLSTMLSAKEGIVVVDEASGIEEALIKVRSLAPHILIMDLAMLKTNSRDSTIAIRQTQPATALLCLAGQDGDEELETAIGAGAQGYMRRDSEPARIVAAVERIAQGGGDTNALGVSSIVPDLQALAKTNSRYARATPLTLREQEVVRLLADGKTVREAALELSLSIKTVEAHKLNLMRKLDIHNRASLVEYAVHSGLITA